MKPQPKLADLLDPAAPVLQGAGEPPPGSPWPGAQMYRDLKAAGYMGLNKMCRALGIPDPGRVRPLFHDEVAEFTPSQQTLARALIRAAKRDLLPDDYLIADGDREIYVIRLQRPGFVAMTSRHDGLQVVAWLDAPPQDQAKTESLLEEARQALEADNQQRREVG